MILGLELKKLRRTGYVPAYLAGGLLAAAVPFLDLTVRPEKYVSLPQNPLSILGGADWQMMAMLHILLAVLGACIMYHTEYANHGQQKMEALPLSAIRLFFGKFVAAILFSVWITAIETAALVGCSIHWFSAYKLNVPEVLSLFGFQLAVMIPTILLMLMIASICQNMWMSLGSGVILTFLTSILPQDQIVVNLCPFSTPYQFYFTVQANSRIGLFIGVLAAETVILGFIELIYLKLRRCFS